MGRRARYDTTDVFEPLAALLRQTTTRALERLRMHHAGSNSSSSGLATSSARPRIHSNNSATTASATAVRPIDTLVVQYCMYYLDLSKLPPSHYLRLAQDVVTASAERVLLPRSFAKAASLPLMCEAIVAEHTAEAVTATMAEVEAFVESRALLGQWIADQQQQMAEGDNDDNDDNDDDGYGRDDIGYSAARRRYDDDDTYNHHHNNDGNDGSNTLPRRGDDAQALDAALDVAAVVYASLEYWMRVQTFLDKLSLGSANVNAYALQPRYERELLLLLHSLVTSSSSQQQQQQTRLAGDDGNMVKAEQQQQPSTSSSGAHARIDYNNSSSGGGERTAATTTMARADVKAEAKDDVFDDDDDMRASPAVPRRVTARDVVPSDDAVEYTDGEGNNDNNNDNDNNVDDDNDDDEPAHAHQSQLATAVLGDALALSSSSSSSLLLQQQQASQQQQQRLRSSNTSYYAMVHARLGVMLARDALYRFGRRAAHAAPELTPQQRYVAEQEHLRRQQQQQQQYMLLSSAAALRGGRAAAGVPVDYVPDDRYYEQLLEQQNDFVDEDEELYKDEVVDYYLRKHEQQQQQQQQQQQRQAARRNDRRYNNNTTATAAAPEALVKPHRFCKVKTGFTWTQYNRTHYDSRTNPPPRTVLWYEFTLFYPALVHTKRDMRHIFHIEELPHGPSEDYCLLVFSVGPPYADVAYRIVKKQWDTRRGGVRISFDATGRYKLFFRFTNSNYRR